MQGEAANRAETQLAVLVDLLEHLPRQPARADDEDVAQVVPAPAQSLEPLREKLCDTMWERVGIIRETAAMEEAARELASLDAALDGHFAGDAGRAFNLAWQDWMNLKSLVAVSRAITVAAIAREDSRGAHFRADFPEPGPLERSSFTSVAPGIAEALITTAAGLFAAIPAVIAYNHLVQRLKEFGTRMDDFALEFLNLVERHFA